ncbi:unnamed protein product [Rotaria sordida]|uniref:Uncharacterized protein n=1 Tax=Rotaria sordida TaxID=392033 RepID=A0A814WA79_9BILA|nr:unnamed protein product [Rotaria sordida]CAF1132170.1 unnamed protein product [Rotaria sordida]CAF1199689.1 unnamed protein product [Rotaria sordida]
MSLKLSSITNAITAQPGTDAKLNPFNTDWSTKYFESCSPIKDASQKSTRNHNMKSKGIRHLKMFPHQPNSLSY